ncbi:MAG: universal stress protein [Thermodesulfobacteriota bacterium]
MTQHLRNILFCSDFSDDAHFAFSHAVYQGRSHGARLHILHVMLSPDADAVLASDQGPEQPDEKVQRPGIEEQALRALRSRYEHGLKGIAAYQFAIRFGSPDVEIIQYARENAIDMIVMGVVGRAGTHRGRLLHTAANVSKYSECQVVTIGRSKPQSEDCPRESGVKPS